ncbi:ATP-binding protein [Streptomyces sp. NPDC050085]|uniref:ATP-binding protein n=1 Tax=Streptomyces sp. NPDC050085 TaxID=3365600 RepID=UPI00379209A6
MGDSLTGVGTVVCEWSMSYTMVSRSLPLIRLHIRRRLTLWCWRGDVEDAVLVGSELATNAIHHGRIVGHTMLVRLALLEDGALCVDVSDPVPAFPNFGEGLRSGGEDECGRGLHLVRGVGGAVFWFLRDGVGKTVRVRLPGGAPPVG